MARTITNSDIKKKGNKFHAVADWRDGSEGGTERQTFDTFDEANTWINELEAESDTGTGTSDNETPAASGDNKPPLPVPGQDNSDRGDLSHSPAAQGQTPNAVPTATDADTIPEPPASAMNAADAENINANVNLPPSTVAAGDDSITNPDPFGDPINDGQTAADTQKPSGETDTSNEVQGVQDGNATPSSSAQQPEEQGSTTESDNSDAGQEKTTDTSKSN